MITKKFSYDENICEKHLIVFQKARCFPSEIIPSYSSGLKNSQRKSSNVLSSRHSETETERMKEISRKLIGKTGSQRIQRRNMFEIRN